MNSIHKREKQTLGIVVSLFFLLLMLLHFAITLVYNFRDTESETVLTRFAKAYTEPLFTQNFKIFAPDVPMVKYKLFVRYQNKNKVWTPWQNRGATLLEQHQRYRFSSTGYEYLMHKNAINELLHARADAIYYATKNKIPIRDFDRYVNSSIQHSKYFRFVSDYLISIQKRNFSTESLPKYIECSLQVENIDNVSNSSIDSANKDLCYWFFPTIEVH